LPKDVDGILAAKKLDVLCNGICDAVVLTHFERMREGGGSAPWLARQRRKIEGGLREMAALIGDKTWAVGTQFGLGDIAAASAAGYLTVRFPELKIAQLYPAFAVYCERLEQRPSLLNNQPFPQTISDKVV
jgi:glutathione S-transferase